MNQNTSTAEDSPLPTIYHLCVLFAHFLTVLFLAVVTYFVLCVYRTRLIHPNFKIVVNGLSASVASVALTRSLAQLFSSAIIESQFLQYLCAYAVNPLHAICVGCTQFTYFCLFMERFLATCKPHGYENRDTTFAKVAMSLLLTIGATFGLGAIALDKSSLNIGPALERNCLSVDRRPVFVIINWVIIAVFTAPTAVALILVHRFNAQQLLRPERGTLSARYQYAENAAVLNAMLPMFLFGSIVFGGSGYVAGGYVWYLLGQGNPIDWRMMIALKSMEIFMDLAGLVYGAAFVWRHPALHQYIPRDFGWMFRVRIRPKERTHRLSAHIEGDVYFRTLAESWR